MLAFSRQILSKSRSLTFDTTRTIATSTKNPKFVVPDAENGIRIDRFLRAQLRTPVSFIQKLLRKKQVFLLDATGEKLRVKLDSSTRLLSGQAIVVPRGIAQQFEHGTASSSRKRSFSAQEANDLRGRVLYKDEHILAINKPPFVSVQGGRGRSLSHMLDALKFEHKSAPKLVHRLDKVSTLLTHE